MLQSFYSQINNLSTFRNLFSLRQFLTLLQRFPLAINLLITARCNLRCEICTAKGLSKNETELTSNQIIAFIKKVTKFRPVFFIGGGEPFIREDLFEVLEQINKFRLRYGIVTNGVLLDERKLNKLLEFEPEVLIFSIHSGRKIYAKDKTFELVCDNIRYLIKKRKKAQVLLNFVVDEDNYKYLDEAVRLGNSLGVDKVRFEHLIFLTCREYKNHLNICKERFPQPGYELTTYVKDVDDFEIGKTLQKTIPRLRKKYGNFVLFKPYLKTNELLSWYKDGFIFKRRCIFLYHSVFIKQNGDIIPCQFFSNFILGNITKDDFVMSWRGQKRKSFAAMLSKGLFPGCMRCCKL